MFQRKAVYIYAQYLPPLFSYFSLYKNYWNIGTEKYL